MFGFNALKGQGNTSTLLAAFLYFDFSFLVWTILGPLATEIEESLASYGEAITRDELTTLLAIPIISAALLRIALGFSVDKIGAKFTSLFAQIVVIYTLFYVAFSGDSLSYRELLIVAIGLGFAGGSFAIALPQVGQWYPPKMQGYVLGITGIGNIGVIVGFLFAPKISETWGWQSVFSVLGVLSLLIFLLYIFMAKDAPKEVYTPRPKKLRDYGRLLKDRDTWWFSLFYAVSFGGFVGFATYMKVYLMAIYFDDMETFGIEVLAEENIHVVAGYFSALTIFSGAILRPVGGAIADRIGGVKALSIFLFSVTVLILFNTFIELTFWVAIAIMFLIMANFGMANGAVFQLVPQRFAKDIGIITGLIGAMGALGGVLVLKILGTSTIEFGNYPIGFIAIATLALFALIGLTSVKSRWRTTWGAKSGGII